ncbi:MAG: glutaredoxin family protein [Burkholderiales bacterium]|nr:glutaredoxin family protein [Burkholderiales bacterium]
MRLRPVVLCLIATLAFPAAAEIYRWVDADGRVYYTDTPPPKNAGKKLKIDTRPSVAPAPKPLPSTAAKPAPSPAVRGEPVRLFTTAWCGYCKKARAYLQSRQIPFEDLDIETSQWAKGQYDALGGQGVPVILVGGRRMDGYDQGGLERMLDASGWKPR